MSVIITIIIIIIIIISSGGDKQLHLNDTGSSTFTTTMEIGAVSECHTYQLVAALVDYTVWGILAFCKGRAVTRLQLWSLNQCV